MLKKMTSLNSFNESREAVDFYLSFLAGLTLQKSAGLIVFFFFVISLNLPLYYAKMRR